MSLIQSLFWGFGAGILEPTTGIAAQNRARASRSNPAIRTVSHPGVRPFHTLMPVLVHDRDGLVGVPGTMGGYQQPQINLHTITRTFVGGAHPADAVAAPRWVVLGSDEGREPSVVALEPGSPRPRVPRCCIPPVRAHRGRLVRARPSDPRRGCAPRRRLGPSGRRLSRGGLSQTPSGHPPGLAPGP